MPAVEQANIFHDPLMMKSLASEEYGERDSELFEPGFLEKASKRLEVEKSLDKVSNPTKFGPQQKRSRYDKDKSDLGSFLAKGASAGTATLVLVCMGLETTSRVPQVP